MSFSWLKTTSASGEALVVLPRVSRAAGYSIRLHGGKGQAQAMTL